MNYLILFSLFLLFGFYLLKLDTNSLKKSNLIIALIIKFFATISVWFIYTYYFSNTSLNDIYKYFNDGKILNESFIKSPIETLQFIFEGKNNYNIRNITDQLIYWTKPNQYGLLNDNQTIILLNFLLCFISDNNILIQSIIISSIAFYATFTLYKTLNSCFSIPHRILFFLMFFNPSYLIWTSGNFKETFIYIGLMFLFSNLIKLLNDKKSIKINIFVFLNLIFILFCKNYFFIFLLPGIIAFYSILYFWKNNKTYAVSFSYLSFLILIIFAGLFYNPVNFDNTIKDPQKRKLYIKKVNSDSYEKNALGENRNIFEVLRFKQRDQQFEAKTQHAHTVIYAPTLDGNPVTFFKCIPFAFINTLFRPNVIDFRKPLFIPDIMTNFIIWLLLFFSFKYKKPTILKDEKIVQSILLYFTLISLVIIGILVPVLGNIVRYRAPILPLLIISLLLNIDFKKIPLFNKL